MRIAVKGRGTAVNDDLRERAARRFEVVSRQVSSLAELELELCEERNPANPTPCVADATLRLKGVTLRARAAEPDMIRAINHCAEELSRQVKRDRDKRRKRREARDQRGLQAGL